MPSGKRSRERRATPPPPVRSKTRGARRASPRVLMIGGGIAAAAIVAIVLAVTLGGGSRSGVPSNLPAVGSLTNALPGAADVAKQFDGIPQRGTTLGKPSAPVTLTEYVDLQCPYCQEFETQVLPSLVQTYVRTGKVKIVLQPWAFIGPDSNRGQAAVLAAAQQDKAFDYAAVLYVNQGEENTGWLDDAMVAQAAASVPGLHVQQLLSDRKSAAVATAVSRVDSDAAEAGVSGTPTIFVGKSQVNMASPTDKAAVVAAIQNALS